MERQWTLTVPQSIWLGKTEARFGVDTTTIVKGLVTHANRQPPGTKKYIFLVIRCQNCGAGGLRGGVKTTVPLSLDKDQTSWLEAVHERCGHASVDKTLRIIME